MTKAAAPTPTPAPVEPSDTDRVLFLTQQLDEQRELTELLERRYNKSHQDGLSIELMMQKTEKRATALLAETEQLKARIKELESNDNG